MEKMIKIPVCFSCGNFNPETDSCPAYEKGIPDEVLFHKQRSDTDCGNGVGFYERPQGGK